MTGMVRHVTEWEWLDLAKHHDGALTKLLVTRENTGARNLDFFLSSYAPKAFAALHSHEVSEEIFYFLEGEGLFILDGRRFTVRPGSVVFVPPRAEHGIFNTGFVNLVFVVTASPPEPLWHAENQQHFPPPGPNAAGA